MNLAKRSAAFLLALCMCFGLWASAANYQRFADVPDGYALANEVNAMASAGIVSGYADGRFRPQDPVTIGAAAKILAMSYVVYGDGQYTLPRTTQTGTFAQYLAFIRTQAAENGKDDSKLEDILSRPTELAQRKTVICMMARLVEGDTTVQNYEPFDDVDGDTMLDVVIVNGGAERTVVRGVGNNKLKPDSVLGRGQAAGFIARFAEYHIVPSRNETEITNSGGKTANELRHEIVNMDFADTSFALTVGRYMYALGTFNSVKLVTEGNTEQIVGDANNGILRIYVEDGKCESYRTAGRGLIGTTAMTNHANGLSVVREIESFCGVTSPVGPTPVNEIKVRAYTDDQNNLFLWLSSVPMATTSIEFSISDANYTIISDAEAAEMNGTVNLYDNFSLMGRNLGDADYMLEWKPDAETPYDKVDSGAVVATAYAYNNDYPDTLTVNATVYAGDSLYVCGPTEVTIPVCDGGEPEPEPLPGFVSVDAYVDGEDMVINVSGLRESAKLTVATFGGFGISLDYEEFQLEPSKGGEITVYASLENSIGPGTYGWVSLTSNATGNDLIDPLRVEITPFLGDYDFPMGVAA